MNILNKIMKNKKTLKDKFYENIPLDDFSGKYSTFMKHAENCEKIAEQFAIDFAKWMDELRRYDNEKYISYTYEYLLEIFKKEKQL